VLALLVLALLVLALLVLALLVLALLVLALLVLALLVLALLEEASFKRYFRELGTLGRLSLMLPKARLIKLQGLPRPQPPPGRSVTTAARS
jgi:hypothetical protein